VDGAVVRLSSPHRDRRPAQNVGERIFWFHIHGRDPFEIAERLWKESGGAERALQPKPVRKPRAIKVQHLHAPKRPFPKGRKLQSRGFEKRAIT
jgi:hypothetical protein